MNYSETGQVAVCCQNLTLGALSSRSALSLLVGSLFKMFGPLFEQASCKMHKIHCGQNVEFWNIKKW
jgi:hypothetical protein